MTVLILRNLGRDWSEPLLEGQRVDVADELGAALVEAGLAEVVSAAQTEHNPPESKPRRKEKP